MKTKLMSMIVAALFATPALGSVFTASAAAAPQWKFDGTNLVGEEDILGAAVSSSITIPGMTTTCEQFLYNMRIENVGGTGKGEIDELPLFDCHTDNEVCTVDAVEARNLPWQTNLLTASGKSYIFIEDIEVGILYGGEECARAKSKCRSPAPRAAWSTTRRKARRSIRPRSGRPARSCT